MASLDIRGDFQIHVSKVMETLSKIAVEDICRLFNERYSSQFFGMDEERRSEEKEQNPSSKAAGFEVVAVPGCTCQCHGPPPGIQLNSSLLSPVKVELSCEHLKHERPDPGDLEMESENGEPFVDAVMSQTNAEGFLLILQQEQQQQQQQHYHQQQQQQQQHHYQQQQQQQQHHQHQQQQHQQQQQQQPDSNCKSYDIKPESLFCQRAPSQSRPHLSGPPAGSRQSQRVRFRTKVRSKCHQQRAFRCDVCSKVFCSNIALGVHKRVHTGEKPFQCEECGKRFNQRSNLTTHKMWHAGAQRFNCPVCGRMFHQLSHLNVHLPTHKRPGKSVKCCRCSKRFTDVDSCRRHQAAHRSARGGAGEEEVRLFSCERCGKLFLLEHHLRRHLLDCAS